MFEKPRISYAIMFLLFVLPQTLYTIGRDPYILAVGIRFPLFRWQQAFGGTSIISVVRELQYVINGNVGSLWGRTAIATYIWLGGVILLFAAAALVISWHYLDNPDHAGYIGPLLFITGGLFLVWGLVQYGLSFSAPSGYFIPVGLPVLWYCGYKFMQDTKEEAVGEAVPG
jgi:hypothetical protein